MKYNLIDYHAWISKSKIHPNHAFDCILLIVKTLVSFIPMKVILPASGEFLYQGGVVQFIYDLDKGIFGGDRRFRFSWCCHPLGRQPCLYVDHQDCT